MENKIKNKIRKTPILLLLLLMLIVGCSEQVEKVSIIPAPLELKVNSGNFIIDENTKIIIDSKKPEVKKVAKYFAMQLNGASGYAIKVISSSEKNGLKNSIMFIDKNIDRLLGYEGYTLKSDKENITLTGSPTGLFYAVQTLFQLLPNEIYSSENIVNMDWKIPSVEIRDTPRFKWRGMHLDVGRFMYPVSFIKKYIDYIAMHKLNTFHWHLTEDQGWRIEIKKYPRLTKFGAWRKGSLIGNTDKIDNQPYGGFYTQDEIREVVTYAEDRFVTVIPEIELPGHSVAALAAYPQFSCTGGPFEVRTEWGIADDIYCAGNDAVFTYLEDVLSEVLELFPSKYIHIGGDEAPKTRWEKCSKCQARIKKEGLKDELGLQNYFISRIEKFLDSKGRQIIGWNEIMEGGLAPNAAVMSWQGVEGGISAAKLKHPVVMTPQGYLYFDNYINPNIEDEPIAFPIILPLEKVYHFEPMPKELNQDEQKYIMGVQGCLWSTYIPTPELAEYMLFPRLCALSEVAWSAKEKRNLDRFLDRMYKHYERLYRLGINYRVPRLTGFIRENIFIDKKKVEFIAKQKGTKIYYTLDGTTPTKTSLLYTKPFVTFENITIKVIEISASGKCSPVYIADYIKKKPIEGIAVKESKKGLKFQYYEFSESIKSVDKLLQMKPVSTGITDNFAFPIKSELLSDKFGLIFNGFIQIPADGVYAFSLTSNDGSTLYIGDKLLVDNDGSHSSFEKTAEIALKAGIHKIQLNYFQAGGGKALQVFIKRKGVKKIEIIENILSH